MTKVLKEDAPKVSVLKFPDTPDKKMLREIFSMSGREALDRILEQKYPQHYVQHMTPVDFFWLIKKIGEDDALPILRLASPEQWQFMLDMELWREDRLDPEQISTWLDRLHRSDPDRLVKWLSSYGQALAYLYMFKNIEVIMKMWDEDEEIPEDFITHDGTYFFRILNKDHEEMIGNILREMAKDNYEQYQALVLGLAGVLPAEAEEGMYRMRNVRLAEEGFLPAQEAHSVYAYLKADSLLKDQTLQKRFLPSRDETGTLVPMTPLLHSQDNNFLAGVVSRLTDPFLLDRVRLEFAGLCNQVISADGLVINDFNDLIQVCRKTAGYLSLGLERLTDGALPLVEQVLKQNPLLSIFRIGFGLALELKWKAEKWVKEAWFHNTGFSADFWGEEWGPTLSGLLQKRPVFYSGNLEKENYREFEQGSDIERCNVSLDHMIALDRIMEILSSRYPLPSTRMKDSLLTFRPLIFTFWARKQLKLKPGFTHISVEQMRAFFKKIRGKTKKAPYRMTGFKEVFLKDFMSLSSGNQPDERGQLKETLTLLWEQFVDEYALVREEELDARFLRSLLIESHHDETLH